MPNLPRLPRIQPPLVAPDNGLQIASLLDLVRTKASVVQMRAEALADPVRFMAYAFARTTHEQMKILRAYVSEDDWKDALDNAPPGIIDPRSWAYWQSRAGRYPAPPLPTRQFSPLPPDS